MCEWTEGGSTAFWDLVGRCLSVGSAVLALTRQRGRNTPLVLSRILLDGIILNHLCKLLKEMRVRWCLEISQASCALRPSVAAGACRAGIYGSGQH